MEIREKIELIIKKKGLSQKGFAESIGLNHIAFNRNINKNNITGEMFKAFAEHLIDIDLNWLLRSDAEQENVILCEPTVEYYSKNSTQKIEQAIAILNEVKKDLSQK